MRPSLLPIALAALVLASGAAPGTGARAGRAVAPAIERRRSAWRRKTHSGVHGRRRAG